MSTCPHRMDFAYGIFFGAIMGYLYASAWAWFCFGGAK